MTKKCRKMTENIKVTKMLRKRNSKLLKMMTKRCRVTIKRGKETKTVVESCNSDD